MSDIQAQFSVLKQTADAKVVDEIARLISDGEDHELNRVNVLDFATQHGVDEEPATCAGLRCALALHPPDLQAGEPIHKGDT